VVAHSATDPEFEGSYLATTPEENGVEKNGGVRQYGRPFMAEIS